MKNIYLKKGTKLLAALVVALFSIAWVFANNNDQKIPINVPESIEVAFSPDGNAEILVLRVINSAQSSIRLAGYSFTSKNISTALINAHQRGVDVALIVDHKNNINQEHARQALSSLANAGIPLRLINTYSIHHDKYIVIDGLHVQTGSFNYTKSAATRNSENVLVIWNTPELAQRYLSHWQSRWKLGIPYQAIP